MDALVVIGKRLAKPFPVHSQLDRAVFQDLFEYGVRRHHVALSLHAWRINASVALVHPLAEIVFPALNTECVATLQGETRVRGQLIVANDAIPAVLRS